MALPKVVELLQSLSAVELRKFEKNLNHDNEPLYPFFQKLVRLYPTFEGYSPEKIYLELFPKQDFQENQYRYLCSDLVEFIEKFLVTEELQTVNFQEELILLSSFRKRNLTKQYEILWKKLQRKIEEYPYRDEKYFLTLHNCAVEYDAFLASQNDRAEINKNLNETIHRLDQFYFYLKMRYACTQYNRSNVLATNEQPIILDSILEHIRTFPDAENPALPIYDLILQTLQKPEEYEPFYQLKPLLLAANDKLTIEVLREMYSFLLNYCIGRLNRGEIIFLNELFELYKTLLDKNILIENGYLTQWNYKNIVTVGLRKSEYEWTNSFIENYVNKLNPGEQKNAYSYNKANLYFYQKNYGKSLKLLQEVRFTDVFYHLDSKSLLMKIYYETNDTEALLAHIQTFKVFLQRDKLISDYQRKVYKNLIKYVVKLSRIKQGSRATAAALLAAVEQEKAIADLTWLKRKINELAE